MLSQFLIDKGTLDQIVFLDRVALGTNQVDHYLLDIPSLDSLEVQIDMPKGRPSWTIVWWISHTPGNKPILGTRRFNMSERSDLAFRIDGNNVNKFHEGDDLGLFFIRDPQFNYYLNFQNLEGTSNFYMIRIHDPDAVPQGTNTLC